VLLFSALLRAVTRASVRSESEACRLKWAVLLQVWAARQQAEESQAEVLAESALLPEAAMLLSSAPSGTVVASASTSQPAPGVGDTSPVASL